MIFSLSVPRETCVPTAMCQDKRFTIVQTNLLNLCESVFTFWKSFFFCCLAAFEQLCSLGASKLFSGRDGCLSKSMEPVLISGCHMATLCYSLLRLIQTYKTAFCICISHLKVHCVSNRQQMSCTAD